MVSLLTPEPLIAAIIALAGAVTFLFRVIMKQQQETQRRLDECEAERAGLMHKLASILNKPVDEVRKEVQLLGKNELH